MLRLEDVPLPRVGEQDVLVRVHFCGLNHSDLNLRRGTFYGLEAEAGQVGWRQTAMRFPLIPGSDIAGVVAAAGAEVSGLRVGDRSSCIPTLPAGSVPRASAATITCARPSSISGPNATAATPSSSPSPPASRIGYPTAYRSSSAALPVNFLTAWHMMITRGRLNRARP